MNKLQPIIRHLLDNQSLICATLSNPHKKTIENPHKTVIRPINIKQQIMYQVSDYFNEKVTHHNFPQPECEEILLGRLLTSYKQGVICAKDNDYHVLVNKNKQINILKKPPTKTLEIPNHNRQKKYLLSEGTPIDFLVHLGVMNAHGKVFAQKQDKFRQINRFIEMVQDVLPNLDQNKTISIVDFGSGKAYLTFALYYYLQVIRGLSINILGLDLKADVVTFCQGVANKLKYTNLNFRLGNIADHEATEKVDMVVTLHACDTATDAALAKAIHWNADIILSVPCCQHEVFNQISSRALEPILSHGILKERFAALATDAARAQILTIAGYATQVMEFIDMEHTPKNLLIRAVRSDSLTDRDLKLREYVAFKNALGISPALESIIIPV